MQNDEAQGTSSWLGRVKRWHPEAIPWPGSCVYNALSRSRIFQRQYQLVAEDAARFCREGVILDIGTGPARLPIVLCRELQAVRMVGLDISAAMIVQARENVRRAGLADRIELKHGAAAELPFEDASFDLVLSSGSLHHFKKPTQALNEMYRVLKPGRHALIYDLVRKLPDDVAAGLRREYGPFRITLLRWHSLEEPFYDPQEMVNLARASEFTTGATRFVGALCCLELQRLSA